MKKLTKADKTTLLRALELQGKFDAGIFPIGGPQHSHFRKLEMQGYLQFVGTGFDIDGVREGEGLVYRLTKKGEGVARQLTFPVDTASDR